MQQHVHTRRHEEACVLFLPYVGRFKRNLGESGAIL